MTLRVAVIDVSKGIVNYIGETDAKSVDGLYYLVTRPDGTRDYVPIAYVFKPEHADLVCNELLNHIGVVKAAETALYKVQVSLRYQFGVKAP